MESTLSLLNKALDVKHAAAWARELNVDPSTLAQAKKRGKLSTLLAGHMAMKLGEDPAYWTALAGIEAEDDGPLKSQLMNAASNWRKR